jgi:hypothetical protein
MSSHLETLDLSGATTTTSLEDFFERNPQITLRSNFKRRSSLRAFNCFAKPHGNRAPLKSR